MIGSYCASLVDGINKLIENCARKVFMCVYTPLELRLFLANTSAHGCLQHFTFIVRFVTVNPIATFQQLNRLILQPELSEYSKWIVTMKSCCFPVDPVSKLDHESKSCMIEFYMDVHTGYIIDPSQCSITWRDPSSEALSSSRLAQGYLLSHHLPTWVHRKMSRNAVKWGTVPKSLRFCTLRITTMKYLQHITVLLTGFIASLRCTSVLECVRSSDGLKHITTEMDTECAKDVKTGFADTNGLREGKSISPGSFGPFEVNPQAIPKSLMEVHADMRELLETAGGRLRMARKSDDVCTDKGYVLFSSFS